MNRLNFAVAVAVTVLIGVLGLSEAQLQMNFYAKSCPNAEKIISDHIQKHIHNGPSLAAPLIRMHFHDCFVRGCDGSVLINSTSGNAEKDSQPNLTLRGFGFVERIKSILEKECPKTVSCADIIALTARDAVVATGGPSWRVPTGRRDGRISNSTEALNNIPPPTSNFTTLQRLFANQGLNLKDLVLLSGAHTIGVSHCSSMNTRLYNFSTTVKQDPSLDSEYATILKATKCKSLNDNSTILEMDPGSRRSFDLSYYRLVLKRRGLFQSDSALTTNSATLKMINDLVNGSEQTFYKAFAKSMEKMGRVKVKTGSSGVIRTRCSVAGS
ncbi:PREDICTED: peroxidase 30 [Camelina sativa]|uniref:Peroxidase n=1 Tax=Camelina sativa TaxID=90675 RepID=A0ABM0Z576_CAMSA|nr:PREDICTED: peroxidase 30 [Camelina sativa]